MVNLKPVGGSALEALMPVTIKDALPLAGGDSVRLRSTVYVARWGRYLAGCFFVVRVLVLVEVLNLNVLLPGGFVTYKEPVGLQFTQ